MPKTAAPPAVNEVETLADRQDAIYRSVETLIMGMVADGKDWPDLTASQTLLCETLGWDRTRIGKEFGRLDVVVRQQKVAGTAADRKAAEKKLDDARTRMAGEGNALRAELEHITKEINSKLATIETAVVGAQKAVDIQRQACEQLRRLVPSHIKTAADRAIAQTASEDREAILELEREAALIETLSSIELHRIGDNRAIEYAKTHKHPELLIEANCDWQQPTINATAWQKHVDDKRAQLPNVLARLRELNADTAERNDKAKHDQLGYYIV